MNQAIKKNNSIIIIIDIIPVDICRPLEDVSDPLLTRSDVLAQQFGALPSREHPLERPTSQRAHPP